MYLFVLELNCISEQASWKHLQCCEEANQRSRCMFSHPCVFREIKFQKLGDSQRKTETELKENTFVRFRLNLDLFKKKSRLAVGVLCAGKL